MTPEEYLPAAVCMANDPRLIWMHAIADIVLMIAYTLIPLSAVLVLLHFRKLRYRWIVTAITVFLVCDATTYAFDLYGLWHPNYWSGGLVKLLTAMFSLTIGIMAGPLILFQMVTTMEPPRDEPDP